MNDQIMLELQSLARIVNREIHQLSNGISGDVATADIRHALETLEEAVDSVAMACEIVYMPRSEWPQSVRDLLEKAPIVSRCSNCGDAIWQLSDGTWSHYGREDDASPCWKAEPQ